MLEDLVGEAVRITTANHSMSQFTARLEAVDPALRMIRLRGAQTLWGQTQTGLAENGGRPADDAYWLNIDYVTRISLAK